MLAIIEAYRAGLLKKAYWRPNIMSGLIVGIVALPLAMAFAIASGVKPEQGIYTAIIAGLVVGLAGGSRVQVAGPTGAFVVVLANITAHYGVDGLQIATLLAGCILLFMGIFKLGSVIKYIPDPVIVGFTAGIGVVIFVGEWKDFFGLSASIPLDARFYQKFLILLKSLPHLNFTTTALACLSLFLLLVTPKIIKRIPGPLIAMLVITLLQFFFHFQHVATLGSVFGGIPQHLPAFNFPAMHANRFLDLIAPAFTIALLGAIESLLSATVADTMTGARHHSNQELIGQGLANMIAPLFGGFAATGAIARTATNVRNGGNSPIAAIVHSVFLLLTLLLLAPLASSIPLCVLAAILFVVAYNMSDIPHFIRIIKKAPRNDVVVLLITFALTVMVNLMIAVYVGVILAMLFFVHRMMQFGHVDSVSNTTLPTLPKNTLLFSIQGPFFFGVAEKIERALIVTHTIPEKVIFQLKDVPFIDLTGIETFVGVIEQYIKRGVKIYLCEANVKVSQKLKTAGVLALVEKNKIFTLTHLTALLQEQP